MLPAAARFVCPSCGAASETGGDCVRDGDQLQPTDDPLLGEEVGGYRIVELIGEGGMGRVYRGLLPSIGAQVAIKVLARELVGEAGMADRLVAEARLANVVRHDGLVNVHGLGVLPDGRPYLIMEYLVGEPLAAMIARSGRIPLARLCGLICEALQAIAPMHERGLVHRDLKPSNLFVTSTGRVKVIDFGIAKLITQPRGPTLTGQMLGTPSYMAPEQLEGGSVDARVDLYALGVVLFEGATGRRPFDAGARLLDQRTPPSVIRFAADLPPALDEVIQKALAIDRAERFSTAAEMEHELQQLVATLPPEPAVVLGPPAEADTARVSPSALATRFVPVDLIGRSLGGFVIREKIGEGGFGVVYRADQPILEREVVIKLLRTPRRTEPGFVDRFLREARLASRLDHPFAAHVYGFGAEPDGLLWIAMERVRGVPLSQLIAERPLPLARLVPVIERLCEVIQTAHDQGIHHRDLKPSNVMVISRAGRLIPKLIDFGIATVAGAGDDNARTGSPPYMAPERWVETATVDHRADLYALGVLVYEALTGRLPFPGRTAIEIAHGHLRSPVPEVGGGLPGALDAVLARAMAKAADDRFASALELGVALRAASGMPTDELPQLDDNVRAHAIAEAPRPIAEAVAAIESVGTPAQLDAAITHAAEVVARWLGALAVAVRTRVGRDAGDSPRATELLARIVATTLTASEWVELARELTAPFRGRIRAHPVPELIGAVDGAAAPLVSLLAGSTGEPGDDELRQRTGLLGAAVGATRSLDDYALIVPGRGSCEVWRGMRRTVPLTYPMTAELEPGKPVLIDRDGVPVLALSPLVQALRPSPAVDEEAFFIDGPGRFGTRLVAPVGVQRRFERHDEHVGEWHHAQFGGSESPRAAATQTERPPYRGLAAFTRDDADVFFGREVEAEAFANRLRVTPFLAVVGPSGVGKSSFVQAGVLPGLGSQWRSVVVRPGATPIASLVARLAEDEIAIVGDLVRDPATLGRALAGASDRFVLVVDQFEEVLTLCRDPDERLAYVTALAAAATDRVAVVVTIRDDFLIRVQQLAPLRDRFAHGLQLLGTPDTDELRRILTEPARRAGYFFDDPALPDEMVREVAERPGALALLSFTALRLWELRDRHFQRLTRAAYDSIGGVGGALAKHAEATLEAIGRGDASAVREAFRHLVTADGTRATVPRRELVELIARSGSTDATAADRVLEQLISARLLLASEGEAADDPIEVIHEALLVSWPRLVSWQREDAENVRLRDQLRAAARQWEARERPSGLLWRGDALLELRLWRARYPGALTTTEDAFVRTSLADEARGRRWRRAITLVAITVLAGGVVALWQLNRRAERSAALAHRELVTGYVEQGRKELIAGNPQLAALYLDEALRQGGDSPQLRLLLGRALDAVTLAIAAVHAHEPPVRWLAQAEAGALVTADDGDRGVLRGWSAPGVAAWSVVLPGKVSSLAVTPAGDRVIVGGADGAVRSYAITDGRLIAEAGSHAGAVRALAAFDAVTISGGAEGMLIWSEPGAPSLPVRAHEAGVRAITIAGDVVASGGERGDVAVWDRTRPTLRWRASGHTGAVRALAITPDGRTVLSAGQDGAVVAWNVTDGTRRGALLGHDDAVLAIAISTDGRLAATASLDGTGRLWSLDDMRQLHSFVHRGQVSAIVLSADGERAITSSGDMTTRAWDVRTGFPLAIYQGHTAPVLQVAESRDHASVITTGADGTVRWWEPRDALHHRVWSASEQGLHAVDWSPDGTRVAAIGADGRLAVWDVAADRMVWRVAAHDKPAWSVRFAPDGSRLATAAEDGRVRVFAATDGALLGEVATGADAAYGLAFTGPDQVAVSTSGGAVALIELSTLRITPTPIKHGEAIWALAAAAGRLATGSDDDHVKVTDVATGRTLLDHVDTRDVNAVALSPDGATVAFGGHDGRVQLYDVATARAIASLEGHTDGIQYVEMTADGASIVTAGVDGTVREWDRSGKPLFVIDAHRQAFARIAPDASSIASVGNDGRVRVWSVAPERRSAAEIAELIACWVPYQLVQQRLVFRQPRCVTDASP